MTPSIGQESDGWVVIRNYYMNIIKTKHNLDFEVGDWKFPDFLRFRVGTCEGLWRATEDAFEILAILNRKPGNGHLDDVFEWFEYSCKRNGKNLRIIEVWNKRFKKYLKNKRGFTKDRDDLIKIIS